VDAGIGVLAIGFAVLMYCAVGVPVESYREGFEDRRANRSSSGTASSVAAQHRDGFPLIPKPRRGIPAVRTQWDT
jgi:hypothetical protein